VALSSNTHKLDEALLYTSSHPALPRHLPLDKTAVSSTEQQPLLVGAAAAECSHTSSANEKARVFFPP